MSNSNTIVIHELSDKIDSDRPELFGNQKEASKEDLINQLYDAVDGLLDIIVDNLDTEHMSDRDITLLKFAEALLNEAELQWITE